jgi:alanyl-tRNA synthetase
LLVPENDPTTLFTGSGMQPMLPYLLGQPHPSGKRIADSQKAFRSQDIEEVGDNRHTTFFEMIGNWSFGDYFKEEQITWMWTFLVEELKLNPENFYLTCFIGNESLGVPRDTYSAELWQTFFKSKGIDVGIGENPEKDGIRTIDGIKDHIFYYSEKKNWWSRTGAPANMPVGEPGGPDTEMFYDFHPELGRACIPNTPLSGAFCHVNCDCGRFVEIGNNVFMQYKKTAQGFEELPQMNVDHGSGLERICAAVNNDGDVFNIDVFDVAKQTIERLSGKKYEGEAQYAFRVILDHMRAATFLVSDGVFPANKDQGYFVRRLIRRAVRFARNLDIHTNFCAEVANSFIEVYKSEYKNLETQRETILSEITKEEEKFRKTLEDGLKIIEKWEKYAFHDVDKDGEPVHGKSLIDVNEVFNLVTSYGMPFELVVEILKEKKMYFNEKEMEMRQFEESFKQKMQEHRELSRTASAGKFKGGLGGDSEMEVKYHTATHLLHQALREVLGEHVLQKGSNITVERLRFDFSHPTKMTDEEKKQVEEIINQQIQKDLPVTREEVTFEEAKARGAIGLFEEKYGDKVSIYRIGEGSKRGDSNLYSIEFCGGPHVEHLGVLGTFKIQKEEAVSAGVRRIKAVLE